MSVLKSTLKLTLLDQVSARARKIGGALRGLQRQQKAMLAPLRGVTGQLLAFGGAYLGVSKGIDGTIGSALKFESAFADVRKVIDGTDGQMENIRKTIIDMSKELPTTANGIAAIFAAAGQANIPLNEIEKFAEMTAKVAIAWDTTEGETGQSLAEIKNQLGLTVSEVGLFADALNHLSNKSAASAPKLLEFSKRIAAQGEMFGFTSAQTLAFGGAMIASGAQADVASTSYRNMGKALTKGEQATKKQRVAFKKLGLDSVKVAKNMQKDALKTTLGVIDKIQALPEWQQISIASALFGDEARGLQPLIQNSSELQRQLGLVADEVDYAGSAFKEYVIRADTVGNTLQILRNKFSAVFTGLGAEMLPGLKEAALGIGEVIDTLGERVSIFDKMDTAWQGFTKGFGIDGDMRSTIDGLGDFFFGIADGSGSADKLGEIFAKFKGWGESVREFSAAIKENPFGQFFAELAGDGFGLVISALKYSLLAVALGKLAKVLYLITGAQAVVGILKSIAGVGGALGLGGLVSDGKPKPVSAGAKVANVGKNVAPAAGAGFLGRFGLLKMSGIAAALYTEFETFKEFFSDIKAPFADDIEKDRQRSSIAGTKAKIDAKKIADDKSSPADQLVNFGKSAVKYRKWKDEQSDPYLNSPFNVLAGVEAIMAGGKKTGLGADEVLSVLRNPPQQDVRVVNKELPNITVNAPITINGVLDPQSAANAAVSELGAQVKAASEASYSD